MNYYSMTILLFIDDQKEIQRLGRLQFAGLAGSFGKVHINHRMMEKILALTSSELDKLTTDTCNTIRYL